LASKIGVPQFNRALQQITAFNSFPFFKIPEINSLCHNKIGAPNSFFRHKIKLTNSLPGIRNVPYQFTPRYQKSALPIHSDYEKSDQTIHSASSKSLRQFNRVPPCPSKGVGPARQ